MAIASHGHEESINQVPVIVRCKVSSVPPTYQAEKQSKCLVRKKAEGDAEAVKERKAMSIELRV